MNRQPRNTLIYGKGLCSVVSKLVVIVIENRKTRVKNLLAKRR